MSVVREARWSINERICLDVKGARWLENLQYSFFAENIALGDLVTVEVADGEMQCDELVEESDNRCAQIAILDERVALEIIGKLTRFGREWEGYREKDPYLAVKVPAEIEYTRVRKYLPNGSSIELIDFREACLSSRYKTISD